MSKPAPPFVLPEPAAVRSIEALRRPTIFLFQRIATLLRAARDADVTFVPEDPLADDPYAEPGHEQNVGWTLGHIIAHLTATMEESAALAAELARGVAYHGRSRSEVSWGSVRTVADCRARLAESRRICLASFGMWPEAPDLANTYFPWEGAPPYGATASYLGGLRHAVAHLPQIADTLAQARADRWRRTR
ncbi:MAG TPA: hypothetical protein VGR57_11610, partial [Ktedonobacterales bacterium]|nr:hypothetical protein [Ktedonobacterales bacterium]